MLVLSVLLCLVCVSWSGIGFTTLASPFPDLNLYYILDGQHKFRAAELLREERERAGVAGADLPDWMCNFRCVEVLQGTPLDIRNKGAGTIAGTGEVKRKENTLACHRR